MTPCVYLPTQAELYQIAGIELLVSSIASYVRSVDDFTSPEKVAVMYRAFCEALIQENLLKLEEAPALHISFQNSVFEIRPKLGSCAVPMEPSNTIKHNRRREIVRQDVEILRIRKLLEVLQQMEKAPVTNVKRGVKRRRTSLSLCGDAIEGSAADRLKFHLENVSEAELVLNVAREKVRLAYYRLGHAYFEWVQELLPTLDVSIISRRFHQYAYPVVRTQYATLFGEALESATTKRLERARKFFFLGSLIGVDLLAACEKLTVTWLDKLPMRALLFLQTECKQELLQIRESFEGQRAGEQM